MTALTFPAPPDLPPATGGGGGEGGVTVHNLLTGRSSANGHPTSAITNLDATLALRQRTGTAPILVPDGGTIPAGTVAALCAGTTATLPDATAHGLGQATFVVAVGGTPCVLSASGSDLLNFGSGVTLPASGVPFTLTASDVSVLAPGAISWGITSTAMIPSAVQALIDASLGDPPTVNDLGFNVATSIEAAVETATTVPYDVPDPWDDNLSGYLLWLAIREQQLTGGLNAQGVIAGRLATTISAQGTMVDVNAGEEHVIASTNGGRWHNLYTDEPAMDVILAGSPSDTPTVSWPNGTKLYFWAGNDAEVNFVPGTGDGYSIIQTPLGTIPKMAGKWSVVTAVWRLDTQEWILYGDLYSETPPHVWEFSDQSADFTVTSDFRYLHYLVNTSGGDVEVTLPDTGATMGLPVRVAKADGGSNDVLLKSEDGLTTYLTITTASAVEAVWNGSTWLVLPY